MIKSYQRQQLQMDFSTGMGNDHPSDIDLYYMANQNGQPVLVLGEIKNEHGTFSKGQRKVLQILADNFKHKAFIIYITHNKRVEEGATKVDVMNCPVSEIYADGKWQIPSCDVTVKRFIDLIKKGQI